MEKEITQRFYEVLQNKFKFKEFRPGQLDALTILMTKSRLLCIQPTGYGKSLLYQLPAIILDGITLVISPLLALMRDQLAQLKNRFDVAAASINSDQSDEENYAAMQAALLGKCRILFISPEQLDNLNRVDFLLKLPISLLVVDEAHCISTWGHDFRPSYRQIIKIIQILVNKNPDLKILGLTATANSQTEIDIKNQLTVDKQKVVVHRESMSRSNIRLSVIHTTGMANKLATLVQLLNQLEGSGLVYCATRENTEIVAEFLQKQEVRAIAYHAGIGIDQKQKVQQDFLQDKYPVIVATNALGMGIDKSNLRFIIHFDFPGSITAYYQEVGRCGRDGLPAEGVLLYDSADSKIQNYFIEAAQPNSLDFDAVLNAVEHAASTANLTTLKRLTGLHPTKLSVILAELIEQGFLEKILINRSQIYRLTSKKGKPNLTRYSQQFKIRTAELKAMQQYAEKDYGCLMTILCRALGDMSSTKCGNCCRCTTTPFQAFNDKNFLFAISSWLTRRTVPITLSKKIRSTIPGIAILDGKLRSPDFVSFMHARAKSSLKDLGVSDNFMELIKECVKDLDHHYQLSCIVPIPSRTWGARNTIAGLIASYLKIPIFQDLLFWQEQPNARQGELLNNDQRQHNVAQRMRANLNKQVSGGAILLFDDYTGSGATLDEAARALRDYAGVENKIIPFTLAAVKWRLGKKGMI